MDSAIEIHDLCQQYGKHRIFTDLNLAVPRAKIIGLLGPNGAGKTTLLKTVTGILPAVRGEIHIFGHSMRKQDSRRLALAQLSFLPQAFTADGSLTVREFVEYNLWMRTFPNNLIAEATTEAISAVGLEDSERTKLRKLSGGMRQRAGIAATIAGEPQLIILDEPTAGLDPQQRMTLRKVLRNLSSTILLSTHLVEDVVSMASHLIVLNKGDVTYSGDPAVLTSGGDRSLEALEASYVSLLEK